MQFGFIFGLEGVYRRNHEVIVARLSVVEITLRRAPGEA
jgi:hypothetical protein